MFAKLFGTSEDQVLVTLVKTGDAPVVRFTFEDEFSVREAAISFGPDRSGWRAADAMLKDMTEMRARELIRGLSAELEATEKMNIGGIAVSTFVLH